MFWRTRQALATFRWFFDPRPRPLNVYPPASAADLRRLFAWYARHPEKQAGRRSLAARVDQVVRGYAAAGLSERADYRERIAGHLDDADPVTPFGLHLAARIAVPEARPSLLALTTTLMGGEPDDAWSSSNGRPADLRPVLIRALGRLRDASLLALFQRLIARAPERSIVYEAAWAIALLEPLGSSNGELPPGMAEDPTFLADLLTAGLPDVRENTLAYIRRLSPDHRDELERALPLTPEEHAWLTSD